MGTSSVVSFSQAGEAVRPSDSIWKDCPGERLNEEGRGIYFHEDFTGGTEVFADGGPFGGHFQMTLDGDVSTIPHKAGEFDGYQSLVTGATDNDAVAAYTQPAAKIVLNSGNKVWFEARLEFGAVNVDQGAFFGLAEEAALSRDIIADNVADLIGESLLGFALLTGDQDDIDAVFKLDAGVRTDILADANFSSVLGSGAARLVANTERKFGLKFDGRDQIQIFVDGIKVRSHLIGPANSPDNNAFPDNVNMAFVLAIKTGGAAARTMTFDWVRGAYEDGR